MNSFYISEQDNFFPTYISTLVRNYILSKNIEWIFHNHITYSDINFRKSKIKGLKVSDKNSNYLNIKDGEGFTYLMIDKDDEMQQKIITQTKYFIEIKFGIKVKNIHRSMLVHMPPDPMYPENHIPAPHVDYKDISKYYNFLYYINDNEAPTTLFDKKHTPAQPATHDMTIYKQIYPKKNKAIIFDGSIYHSAGISRLQRRLTLNMVVIPY